MIDYRVRIRHSTEADDIHGLMGELIVGMPIAIGIHLPKWLWKLLQKMKRISRKL